MFNLFQKKKAPVTLEILRTDMHSHLIPGIDDGSPDVETSVHLIRGLEQLGYSKLITTPHIMWDMYKNTPEIIQQGYQQVKAALKDRQINVSLEVAAEYYLDDHVDRLLDSGAPLLSFKDNLVLVEFSFVQQPPDLKNLIFKLQIKGYQPVIAHPERYLYLGAQRSWYDEMKETGCYFQLNLLSLSGHYGRGSVELAEYLIKNKYYNLIGTDLHHQRHLDMLRSASSYMGVIQKLLDTGLIINAQL